MWIRDDGGQRLRLVGGRGTSLVRGGVETAAHQVERCRDGGYFVF
jgi:hypothetical protein